MNAPFERRGGRRPEEPGLPKLTPTRRSASSYASLALGFSCFALGFVVGSFFVLLSGVSL